MINRRQALRLGAGGLALTSIALLEACGPTVPSAQPTSPPPKPTSPPAGQPTTAPAPTAQAVQPTSATKPAATEGMRVKGVLLPARVPFQGVQFDFPASEDGLVDAGLINMPANPVKSVPETPGRGGDVSVVTWTTGAAPTPMESNALWQAVNKELGVNLNISVQAQADYATVKLPTLIAGNELPDLLYMATNAVIPQLPAFLKSRMADLTPYLSGDAVKEFPNLANFPSIAWRQVIYNNAIYGVPVPFPQFLWVHWVHQNLLDAESLERPKNAEEYKRQLLHFTRPNQNLWGMGVENNVGMGTTNGWLSGIFGAPNIWSLDNATGKLTHTSETEQFRAAVGYARDLWNAGVMHPNALQYNLVSARNDFAARRFAYRFDGFQQASYQFWDAATALDPPGKPRMMTPFPAEDGGTPTYWANSGILGYTAIKQAPPERIKEMLRILNWIAAPIGTQEYQLMRFGLKDVHWTPDELGNPILNDRGRADALVPFWYITEGPVALYYPKDPAYAPHLYEVENVTYPYLSHNPTNEYYSSTNASKNSGLQRDLSDKINEIVVGRQPLTYFDQVVREWREGGGDQIRQEFEQEIAAARTA